MKMIVYICDACDLPIHDGVFKASEGDGDYCSRVCASGEIEEACTHEENASDETQGKSTARLVCKKCGYDRIVEVA